MRTAVVTVNGEALRVELVSSESEGGEFNPADCAYKPETETATECGEGPGPIIPEMKELAWGAGAFIVFALLMRIFLFPRLRKGMDARYNSIRDGHEAADAARASARSEVAQYEAAVSAAKADAAKVVDAARATLESGQQDFRPEKPLPPMKSGDVSKKFHTYGFLWTEKAFAWYIDGKPVHKLERKEFVRPMHVTLTHRILEEDRPKLNLKSLPDDVDIDWVKVWK